MKYFCLLNCKSWGCDNWKHGARTGAAIALGIIIPIGWVVLMILLCKKGMDIALHEAVKKELGDKCSK